MKTLRLLLLTATCVTLTGGISYAVPVDDTKHQQNENESAHSTGHGRTKDQSHTRGPSSAARVNRPQQPGRPATGNAKSGRQPLMNPASGTVSSTSTKNSSANKVRSAQPSPASRISTLTPINTPHHSLNPARVGGPAISAARNPGAINGTSMKRKP
jgi:hypothetical protein